MHSSLCEAVTGKLQGRPNCAKYCASDLLPPSLYFAPNSPLFSTKEKWNGKIKFFRSKAPARGVGESSGERTVAGQSGGKPTRCGTCHWFSQVNGTVARGQMEWMCLNLLFFPVSLASCWMSASRSRYPWLRLTAAFLHSDYTASLFRRWRSRTCHPVALDY